MDVERNTYNIQEVGLAKALVRKGHICDIVFWTNKEEKNITIAVEDCGNINVFYRHGKTALKNTVYTNCTELFEQYDICTACYASCPKEAISMVVDEEGFEYPQIDVNKCIRCYQCIKVCPFKVKKMI